MSRVVIYRFAMAYIFDVLPSELVVAIARHLGPRVNRSADAHAFGQTCRAALACVRVAWQTQRNEHKNRPEPYFDDETGMFLKQLDWGLLAGPSLVIIDRDNLDKFQTFVSQNRGLVTGAACNLSVAHALPSTIVDLTLCVDVQEKNEALLSHIKRLRTLTLEPMRSEVMLHMPRLCGLDMSHLTHLYVAAGAPTFVLAHIGRVLVRPLQYLQIDEPQSATIPARTVYIEKWHKHEFLEIQLCVRQCRTLRLGTLSRGLNLAPLLWCPTLRTLELKLGVFWGEVGRNSYLRLLRELCARTAPLETIVFERLLSVPLRIQPLIDAAFSFPRLTRLECKYDPRGKDPAMARLLRNLRSQRYLYRLSRLVMPRYCNHIRRKLDKRHHNHLRGLLTGACNSANVELIWQ